MKASPSPGRMAQRLARGGYVIGADERMPQLSSLPVLVQAAQAAVLGRTTSDGGSTIRQLAICIEPLQREHWASAFSLHALENARTRSPQLTQIESTAKSRPDSVLRGAAAVFSALAAATLISWGASRALLFQGYFSPEGLDPHSAQAPRRVLPADVGQTTQLLTPSSRTAEQSGRTRDCGAHYTRSTLAS